MNIAYRWLQEYVKTTTPPAELGERFRMTSSEMESITDWSTCLPEGLISGVVKTVAQHPNADRLRVADVDTGERVLRHIVCGAPNLREGMGVLVATPGTTLTNLHGEQLTISESVIRGETSLGMLCGADEIGLPIPGDGLLELPATVKPGTPAAIAIGLDDQVLDLEITPNRPDLLSYYGLAREVSTFERKLLAELPLSTLDGSRAVKVTTGIEESKLSRRLSAVCLENVRIEASPLWLQARLVLAGMRPVNTVVDATNYVMLELGLPLHAYDADTLPLLKGAVHLEVRGAQAGEVLTTLDGVERKLVPGDIVIADANNTVIGLAGIMGGSASAISSTTKRVLIEAASFSGPAIRRTSRRLNLRSEASGRFEKGLDPEMTVMALKRVAYLLNEIAGATVCSALADTYPKSHTERQRIHLSFDRIQQVLGICISAAEVKPILQHLGFHIASLTKSSFEVVPPSWRGDVTMAEDVIEELVRIWGYDRLPSTLLSGEIRAPRVNSAFEIKKKIRHTLAGLGFRETVSTSFTSTSTLTKLGLNPDGAIALLKPLSSETELLVSNHMPAFLTNISGVNLHETHIKLLEIGSVFSAPRRERIVVSALLRSDQDAEGLYREAKAVLSRLATVLAIPELVTVAEDISEAYIAPGGQLAITCQGTRVGYIGLIDPQVIQRFKIRTGRTVVVFELDFATLLGLTNHVRRFVPPSPFPVIERDVTFVVAEEMSAALVLDAVRKHVAERITRETWCTTIYRGTPVPKGKKAVTVHIVYGSNERTLVDAEVNEDMERLIGVAQATLNPS